MTDLARALSVLADARQLVALAECAQIERDVWRLMFRAAMDQLAMQATKPERYAAIQRELRQERERFMTCELGKDGQ